MLGLYPQTKNIGATLYSIINSATGKYCSVTFIWMVTLEDFIQGVKSYQVPNKRACQGGGGGVLVACLDFKTFRVGVYKSFT